MSQRELRVVPVMVHLEPTLHTKLLEMVDRDQDTASTTFRSLLVKELKRRNMLTDDDTSRLIGA